MIAPVAGLEDRTPITMHPCSRSDYLPAGLLFFAAFTAVVVATLSPVVSAPTASASQVAVIFPPWVGLAEAIDRVGRANGLPVRQGLFANTIVVQPRDGRFVTAVRDQGALFVIDPAVIGGCVTAKGPAALSRPP